MQGLNGHWSEGPAHMAVPKAKCTGTAHAKQSLSACLAQSAVATTRCTNGTSCLGISLTVKIVLPWRSAVHHDVA